MGHWPFRGRPTPISQYQRSSLEAHRTVLGFLSNGDDSRWEGASCVQEISFYQACFHVYVSSHLNRLIRINNTS